MSSITPPSFVDDGGSFQKRTPHGLRPIHIATCIDSSDSDSASAYTGSYIDDGADMLYASKHGPGFGQINPRFYKQRKRKEGKEGAWNEDIQKAVAGDIQGSLEKMQRVTNLEFKRPGNEYEVKESGRRRKKDTVTIPMPPRWGTFVIKAEHGRVIVIDEDGEFDSGPQMPAQQPPAKWVKAPSTIDTPSLPQSPPKYSSARDKDRKRKDKKKHKHLLLSAKSLTPIQESEYEIGYTPSVGEDLDSPTGFFMTGGASGWPSQPATPFASPTKSAKSSQQSYASSPPKPASPVRSPPGSWPSPPQSPSKTLISASTRHKTWGEQKSHSSSSSKHSRRSGQKDHDNVSTKSCSTYRPATVEDAPDTSSENASILKEVAWGGSQKHSDTGWGGSNNGWEGSHKSSHKSSRRSSKAADNVSWIASQPASDYHVETSVQNWVGDRVKTISEASTHKSRSRSHRSRSHRSHSQSISHTPSEQAWEPSAKGSEASWDGYEKPKTLSEVSVAGTGSERSWPESQASSRHGSRTSSHRNNRNHGSSRHDSQSGWEGSNRSWGGSQKANVDGWTGDRMESEGGDEKYVNAYDEDNKTYLNENWGGVKVRVGSRRESVAGWD
tara:strand:- start:22928 stop:24760 length:1833 start_codon:yes stop_codon:yes gene_type:complete